MHPFRMYLSMRQRPVHTAILACLFVSGVGPAIAQAAVVIETVAVGNPGNAGENAGESEPGGSGPDRICGAVNYVYSIGKFEVTAGQYAEFLNAVADDDTYGLYSPTMANVTDGYWGCKIDRAGSSPNYTYSAGAEWADRPVNYVSWGTAARFANWLHNGQPTGAQSLTTTEDGSYFLNGAVSDADLLAVTRKLDATWVIPSEDEWYKAAYHKNDGVTANYYDYPTSNDSVPGYVNDSGNLSGTGTPFAEGGTDPGNYATYNGDFDPYGIGPPYYRTEVGEWENSDSPYGTFDQGGNVAEWNDGVIQLTYSMARGAAPGAFTRAPGLMHAAYRGGSAPAWGNGWVGFRVANVSEQGTTCGDGMLDPDEQCDDGNTDDGDGCSSTCTIEDGWDCTGEPSVCTDIDECLGSPCDPNATCTNLPGSFTCECNEGYEGDGFSCAPPPPIPTVSEWGMIALTLLLLSAGVVLIGRKRLAIREAS